MNRDLQDQVSGLISSFLIRDARNRSGETDCKVQAKTIACMLNLKSITSVFDEEAYKGVAPLYRLERYRADLQKILARYDEHDKDSLDLFKGDVLSEAFCRVLESNTEEAEVKARTRREIEYRSRIFELEEKIEYGKLHGKVTFWDRLNSAINFPYLIVLALIIAMLASLVILGLTSDISISIDFSVGEIIGALLVGSGVAAAGISYATKRDREEPGPQ